LLVAPEEIQQRRAELKPFKPENHTPWEEFYRQHVGQLDTGACFEFATKYHDVRKIIPRHSH
jgi:dihydroxyacid dehydratase/phosphogluconate dehydratase